MPDVLIVNISRSEFFAKNQSANPPLAPWWFLPGGGIADSTAIEECTRGVWFDLPLSDGKPPFDCVIAVHGRSHNYFALACYRVKENSWQCPPVAPRFPRRWQVGTFVIDGKDRAGNIQRRWQFEVDKSAQNQCAQCRSVIGWKLNEDYQLDQNGCYYADHAKLDKVFPPLR